MPSLWSIVKNKECRQIDENKSAVVVGDVCLDDIQTSQIGNVNGIARGCQSNPVRKTKCFAKKVERVDKMYEMFQMYRNFMKQDKNKMTPAMKEAIRDAPLNWVDFLNLSYQI